jgi:hypothetical protein
MIDNLGRLENCSYWLYSEMESLSTKWKWSIHLKIIEYDFIVKTDIGIP